MKAASGWLKLCDIYIEVLFCSVIMPVLDRNIKKREFGLCFRI